MQTSSIARPRRTDEVARARNLHAVLPGLLIALVLASFRPFGGGAETSSGVAPTGGDAVNQIGFGLLGLLCGWLWWRGAVGERWRAFVTPLWLLVPVVLAYGVANADAPGLALRATLFSLIVVLVALTALMLPRTRDEFLTALSIGAGTVIALCYVAVLAFPAQGVHPFSGAEAQHGGLWRGVFDHKNVASYVVAGLVLMGAFLAFEGRPRAGWAIALAAALFTLQAGSKTVLAVAPLSIGVALLVRWISWGWLRLLVLLAPLVALNLVTIGAVLHPPLLEWLRTLVPGLSYTGRTDLWEFGLEHLASRPWTGFGYESFWATPRVVRMEQPIELSWDVRGIVHGHNSWLDAAIGFGIPGLAVLVLLLVFRPVLDYLRVPREGRLGAMGTLFIALWLLTALGASLESFFLRRADPVWFTMLLALAGLRLGAWGTRQAQRG